MVFWGFFHMLLKIAFHILRSYLRHKTLKKMHRYKTKLTSQNCWIFFLSTVVLVMTQKFDLQGNLAFCSPEHFLCFGQCLYNDLGADLGRVSTLSPANSTAGSSPDAFKAFTPWLRRVETRVFAGELACGMLGLAHPQPVHSLLIRTWPCMCDQAASLQTACLHANSRDKR